MTLNYIAESFKGTGKQINNDFFIVLKNNGNYLFLLFDGVSSAKNAKLGISKSVEYIKENYIYFYKGDELNLKKLMFETNRYLTESPVKEAYTTYVALSVNKKRDRILMSTLGDSRAYGISNQYITQYSKDDKWKISHMITKCLGMENLERADFSEIVLSNVEKKVLLCSDGFYSILEKNKHLFFEVFNFNNLSNTKKRILREIKNKNEDDATYILINLYV